MQVRVVYRVIVISYIRITDAVKLRSGDVDRQSRAFVRADRYGKHVPSASRLAELTSLIR